MKQDDRDQMSKERPARLATHEITRLPAKDPTQKSLRDQRAEIASALCELTSSFQFMGTSHPQFETTKKRIEELRMMLERLATADR